MAFSGVRTWWSSVTGGGGPRRSAAETHDDFLPPDSVVINDRKRQANKLGEGSFAKVYRGEYNGKPCAVKVFKEDARVFKKELTPDPGSTTVQMLLKMQHENIVQMFGMWLDPHKDRAAVSIVMELCDESLYEFIRRFKGKLVYKEKKLRILQDMARGMVYLHSQNIVHGDLRSGNVLLCHSEDQTLAKLADFDMARLLEPDTQRHLTTRFTAEEYLPPEVFDHKEHKDPKRKSARLTPKVDVFCFGELVLEMACGAHPTPIGKFREREMLTELQRRDKYLLKLKQSDKESLGSIIRKCLADAPDGRPSFTEILLDVEGHLHKYGERPDLEKLEDKTAECEVLRAEAVKLQDDAKSLCSTQDMLEGKLEKEKAEKEDLQINLQIQKTEVEKLQRQLQDYSQRERDALEKSFTMSDTLKSALEETKEELNNKTQLLETRDTELKVLHGKLADSELQMKTELQRKEADWTALQEDYHRVVSEKDRLTSELSKVRVETDDLKKSSEEAKTAADEELAKTKKERDALREDVEAVHEALNNKTDEHAKVVMEVTTLNEALEQKAGNIGELQGKSHEQEKVIQRLNRDLLNMKQEVEQLKSKRDILKKAQDDVQTSLKTSEESAASVVQQQDQLQKKLQDKESANAKLLKSLTKKEEMKTMKQQIAKAQNSANGKDDRITKLQNKVSEMDVQLKRKRKEWASERDALQQEMTKARESGETRESEMDVQLKKERKEWASERAALQQEMTKAQEAAETKASEMNKEMNRERHEWDSERSALQQEVATGKEHAKTLQAQLKTDMAATAAQLQQAAAANDEMKATLQQLQEECEHLKQVHQKKLAEKMEELNSVKREHKMETETLNESHATLIAGKEKALAETTQDVARLQKELEQAKKTFESAMEAQQKELDAIGKHSRTCESERDSLREEKRAWVKTEAGLRDSVKKLEKTCIEVEQNRMALQSELQVAKSTVEAAKTQQQADYQKISSLQDNLQAEKDKLHSTEETAHQKEKEFDQCRVALQAEKDKLHSMEKIIRQKEKELEQCKNDLAIAKTKKRHQVNAVMTELKGKLDKSENQKAKLLEEKDDHKKRENALLDTVRELEKQHSDLKRELSMHEHERDKLKKEKTDVLLLNQQMTLAVQQQTEEKEKALKDKEEHIKQFKDVETRLHRLSGNHAKKMADLNEKIQSLQDELMEARNEREQHTVQETLTRKNEASEEQHRETTRLQEENSQLRRQLTNIQGEKMKLMDEMAEHKSKVSLLRLRLEQKQKEFLAVTEKKDSLDAQFVHVNEENRALLDSKHQLTSRLEETQSELVKQTATAQVRAKEQEAEFQKSQQQLQEVLSNLSNMERVLKDEKEQGQKQCSDYRCQIAELQKTVEIAQQCQANQRTTIRRQLLELQEQKKEKEDFEEHIHQLEKQLERTSKELSGVQESLAEKQAEYATIDSAKRQLEVELQEKIEHLQLAQERVANLDESLQSMTTEREDAMLRAATAEEQNAKMEKALYSTSTRLDEMTKQCQLSEQDKISFKTHLDEKSAEAEELRAKCSELKSSLAREEACMADMSHSMAALSADRSNLEERLAKEEKRNAHLLGQLAENHRVEEANRNELEAARLQRFAADTEKKRAEVEKKQTEEKCLEAYRQLDSLKEEHSTLLDKVSALEKEHSSLQDRFSDLEKEHSSLQDRFSDLETANDKLQASQRYAEQLEAERDDYQTKFLDSNEWIMQHLHSQDKESSLEHISKRTEFHTMMAFFKVYYDKASKQTEQTAEENQRLLASNDEIKEKVQELAQASQALQEKLTEKQQFLDEQQREIKALRAKLSSCQEVEVFPAPLASDVHDVTGDEAFLQQLCYLANGIKQILIGPDGGTFTLGSGDAYLEFPSGAVEKETVVRYAIILHGPFVLPAGYKLGSVVVYLNVDGATLKTPVLLFLSHWCIRKEGVDEDTLKFLRAPHTLEAGQEMYVFQEQEEKKADFTTRANVGVLTIQEPQCLYCVQTTADTTARCSAITFSQYIPSEDTLYFRIQLMCDSVEWNEELTRRLQHKKWEKTSNKDSVTQFEYAQQQITARPRRVTGPGWEAAIDGHHAVKEQVFLAPVRKSTPELDREITSGHFPPCILYKIIYTTSVELRVKPAMMMVDVDGADVPLSFSCRIKEEISTLPPVSPASSEPVFGAAMSPSPMDTAPVNSRAAPSLDVARSHSPPEADISNTADVIKALNHQLDAQWREFGTFLYVKPAVMDGISKDKSNVASCMLLLVEKWLYCEDGTGNLPRTWKTVVQAVKDTGKGLLAQQLAEQHGVQLTGQ